MQLTREQAMSDLSNIMKHIGATDDANGRRKGANLLLNTIPIIEERLDNLLIIRYLYVDNPHSKNIVPLPIRDLLASYINNGTSKEHVKVELDDSFVKYSCAFMNLGINIDDKYIL